MLEVHAQVRLRSQNKRKTKHVWCFLFAVWEYLARKCPHIVKLFHNYIHFWKRQGRNFLIFLFTESYVEDFSLASKLPEGERRNWY